MKSLFYKVLVGKVKILPNSYVLSMQAGKQPAIFDVRHLSATQLHSRQSIMVGCFNYLKLNVFNLLFSCRSLACYLILQTLWQSAEA